MSSAVTVMLLLVLLAELSLALADPGERTEAGVLHWEDRLLRVRRMARSDEGRRVGLDWV